MEKRATEITAIFLAVILGSATIIWLTFRNPYDSKFFTEPIQKRYQSVGSVLEVYRTGWKSQSESEIALLSEAYGWDQLSRSIVRKDDMPEVKEISYYRSDKLAVVSFVDGSAIWLIWKDGRWVLYPETPWLPLLEMIHGATQQEDE